jgi:hypothetical protein
VTQQPYGNVASELRLLCAHVGHSARSIRHSKADVRSSCRLMSASDPLPTFATERSLRRVTRSALPFAALVTVASSAIATTPPPAPKSWTRIAWECPGQERSFIEIEQFAQGSSGYQTKVLGLVISGRKVNSATVAGLHELIARRNFLRPVGGYCERAGESIGIEELGNGPKRSEAGWRDFRIPYPPRP